MPTSPWTSDTRELEAGATLDDLLGRRAALPRARSQSPAGWWRDRAAVDTELGVLKTGKEADVFLLHRGVPGARRA